MCVNAGSSVSCNNCKYNCLVRFPGRKKDQQHSRINFQPTYLASEEVQSELNRISLVFRLTNIENYDD